MTAGTLKESVQAHVKAFPWPQIYLALAALGLGVLVYVVDRPPGATALPESITLFQPTVRFFGAVGQSLPAFAHVFAFSVLTAALLGGGRRAAITVCTGWFLVDAAFELGQHPAINAELAKLIPSWFEAIPILDRTDELFARVDRAFYLPVPMPLSRPGWPEWLSRWKTPIRLFRARR